MALPPQAVEAPEEAVDATMMACPPQAVEAPEAAVEATKAAKRTKITMVARQQATMTLAPPITIVVRQKSARRREEVYLLISPSVERGSHHRWAKHRGNRQVPGER